MIGKYRLFRSQVKKYGLSGMGSYFFRWNKSLKEGASSVKDEQPWITFTAIDYLQTNLKPNHHVFEYGGGGSTLFFLNRVAEVVTVEHSKEWFEILQNTLKAKGTKHWKGQFISPEQGDLVPQPDKANPLHYSSDDLPSKGYHYKAYASAIDVYADAYFDCVLVDGRARPSCIYHALKKIKPGGLLVLDNSDRAYYLNQTAALLQADYIPVVDQFAPCPYLIEFTKTTIWKKAK